MVSFISAVLPYWLPALPYSIHEMVLFWGVGGWGGGVLGLSSPFDEVVYNKKKTDCEQSFKLSLETGRRTQSL